MTRALAAGLALAWIAWAVPDAARAQQASPAAEPSATSGPDGAAAETGAVEEAEDEIKGTYLGAGFVYGMEQFGDVGTHDVDDSPGFSAWIGHSFLPQVGVEVQWEWIDEFEIDDYFEDIQRGRGNGDLETHALTLNARLLPLAEVDGLVARYVQPFVRVGAGFVAAEIEDRFGNDTNDAAFVLRGGAGIQWMFTRRFSFNTSAEYVYPTDDIDGVEYNYISVTGAFQFVY
ncbi:MAG: outer membrane beta-barrel protein [Myxococcota bacterium]